MTPLAHAALRPTRSAARRTAAAAILFFLPFAATGQGPVDVEPCGDVEACIAEALENANARLACHQQRPDERQPGMCSPCGAASFPPELEDDPEDRDPADPAYALYLKRLLVCEVERWQDELLALRPALGACASRALADRLSEVADHARASDIAALPADQVDGPFQLQSLHISTQDVPGAASSIGPTISRWVLFADEPDLVELGREDDAPPPGEDVCTIPDPAGVRAAIDAAVSVNRYASEANRGLLKRGAAGLAQLRDDWEWFLEHGLGQFPWERALNGLFDRRGGIGELPERQLVALHPSVAAELDEDDVDLDELSVHDVLLIEPIGFVDYRFREGPDGRERWYWGASLLVSLREDEDPGVGLLLRRNDFGLGAIWREVDDGAGGDTDQWSLALTLDLLGKVQKDREKLVGYRDGLERLLD